ncbi:elongation factor Ts [Striga asiatica]|uniref:Elongation factor Ts, mitochondrial n=1 Tax=Striga asiatica TaxID=4170 RepID=A0A5A7Q7R0_STRAF|nr:elongation factor Ts [Striga asiatica]
MAPVNSSISSHVSLTPGSAITLRKSSFLPRCSKPRNLHKATFPPLSTSISLFPQFLGGVVIKPKQITHILCTTPSTPLAVEEEEKEKEIDSNASKSKRSRPTRKSEMPPVKNEELVPGATFKGKVRSIQPFGAFVDFGAFTDGLVHVSKLSSSFVKDVANVVKVGQEVTVRLIEANMETGRISLTMRDSDEPANAKAQQQQKQRDFGQKRNENRKSSKFVKGQELEGTVKNLTRAGAFISLPDGEEGFLPTSEEAREVLGYVMGSSSLEVGQVVSVRVLRVNRGQLTLTMKKEEDAEELDVTLGEGVVHSDTNPFVLAFRGSPVISALLDKREKADNLVEEAEGVVGVDMKDYYKGVENEEGGEIAGEVAFVGEGVSDSMVKDEEQSKEGDNGAFLSVYESESELSGEFPAIDNAAEKDGEPLVSEELEEVVEDEAVDDDGNQSKEQEETAALNSDENGTIESSGGEIISENQGNECTETMPEAKHELLCAESVVSEDTVTLTEVMAQTTVDSEQNGNISSPREPNGDASPIETTTKADISPALVKQLREETGSGMMDCKKALLETGGDLVQALEYLRKKGLASADKKASRATAEGRIGTYIHDSRIGVLIEVNCETDFVARGDIFKELIEDLAMQVAACPQVKYLDTEDIPKEIVDKEREMEMQKEDLLSKPEPIRSKIVDGRIRKRLEELALLEQPFIKNDKVIIKDWVKQTISTVGENIKVKRFVRYNLGEGLEKKSQDFAAEVVAAQTASKSVVSTSVKQEEPAAEAETTEAVEEPLKVAVSASLVKQLREESGAGMMDCKKALSESGGDLAMAHEYLRKKGLSTADKKSGRAAAEGRVGAYIHDSRIGVLIEVNCETDFVGRSQVFKELVDDLAMQVVACPNVKYVSVEDIPESFVSREKELEMQREDLKSRPENVREKIVEGRVAKRLGELALLEQPFIKNDGVIVKDLVKQTVAALGENVKVRRFVRFTLGEN